MCLGSLRDAYAISLLSPSCHFHNFLSLWQIFVDTHTVCVRIYCGKALLSPPFVVPVFFFSLLSSVTYCVRMPFLALETIGPITKGLLSSTLLPHSLTLSSPMCALYSIMLFPLFSVCLLLLLFFCLTMAWKRRGLYTFIFLEKWLLIVFLKQEKVVVCMNLCAHNTFYFNFTKRALW